MNNIFRFIQAGSEVSALLGQTPSAGGHQPTLADKIRSLQERIISKKSGSIISVQVIYVPADDFTDSAPATTVAHWYRFYVSESNFLDGVPGDPGVEDE